jgi:hypothetical protein
MLSGQFQDLATLPPGEEHVVPNQKEKGWAPGQGKQTKNPLLLLAIIPQFSHYPASSLPTAPTGSNYSCVLKCHT